MTNEEQTTNVVLPRGLWGGMVAGAGFMLGWFITRWLIMFIIVIVGAMSLCSVALKHEAGTTSIMNKIEKATKINLVDPKVGRVPGSDIRYHRVCNIRTGPSTKSDIIGKTKVGNVFKVLGTKGEWKMIQLTSDVVGWTGCRMPL